MNRVLMTVDAVGGVWRYAIDLARGLKPLGYEVIFAGSGPEPDDAQRMEAGRLGEIVWLEQPLDWMVKGENELEAGPAEIVRLATQSGASIIHLNLPSQAAGIVTDIPVVSVSHSCVVTWWAAVRGGAIPEDWAWQHQRNRAGFRRSSRVIAPSRSHAAALQRCYGPLPVEVVENAIALDPGQAGEQPFVFAAGRWWDEAKNGSVLDRAAADLPWPVLMAGATEGPSGQRSTLAHARMLGALPHHDVLAHSARCGIFVSPSRYEPFGLSALEAARLARPLLLADIPTYRELWNDAALFFDPNDAAQLAAQLHILIDDKPLRRRLSRTAQARSLRFTLAGQAEKMAALYRAAASSSFNVQEERVA